MTQSAPIDAEPYRAAPARATRAPATPVRQSGRVTGKTGATAGEEGLGAYRARLQGSRQNGAGESRS